MHSFLCLGLFPLEVQKNPQSSKISPIPKTPPSPLPKKNHVVL